jgi:hypothetical protein
MKGKVVLGMLAVMGALALSPPVAQAGHGGFPSPLTSFFVCTPINGDRPNQSVEIESQIFGPFDQSGQPVRLRNVQLGNGVLACAWAKLFPKGANKPEIDPNPLQTHQHLKCYTASVTPPAPAPTTYTVRDQLFKNGGVETNVQTNGITYVCAPATFERPPQ